MPQDNLCGGCGTELSPDARYCVKCGRTRSAPVLDLERLDVEPAGGRGVERAVAEQSGPRPPRRGSLLAIAALLVLLVGAAVVLSGGDSGGGGESAAPSTTVRPTSTTRAPRRSTTTTWQPSIMVGQVGEPGPVLGAPTGGLSLYVASGPSIVRVELDSGAITVRNAFRRSAARRVTALVVDDRLVLGRDGAVFVSAKDLRDDPLRLDGFSLEDSPFVGRLLMYYYPSDVTDSLEISEFDPDGNIVNRWLVPAQAWSPGVIGDQAVVQSAGRIYLVSPDGEVRPYGVGESLYADHSHLLWRHCDDAMRCTVTLDDLNRGTSLPLTNIGGAEFYYFGQFLSADGRTAAVSVDNEPRLVDLETGETLADLDGVTQPAWTPDGSWAFTRNDDNSILAISTRGEDPRVITMPAGFSFRAADLVLTVG